MRILVIDDSKTMRSILLSYLNTLGFECEEAVDGLDALEVIERDVAFDAVLIDWDMPRMDGLTLLKEIRSRPEWDGIKAVMVTAQSDINCVASALASGADDYLMKPLDEAMFVDKLRLVGLVE